MKLVRVREFIKRLHEDERGDIPVGPLLLIGLIAIPLVIALVAFGDVALDWLKTQWDVLSGTTMKNPFGNPPKGP